MRALCFGLLLLLSPAVNAQTSLGAALQTGEPAMLTSTHHTLNDALAGAVLQNAGKAPIASYKLGWVLTKDHRLSVHESPLITVANGAEPGTSVDVPDQMLPFDTAASGYLFYVSEVHYADGTHWSADAEALLKQAKER